MSHHIVIVSPITQTEQYNEAVGFDGVAVKVFSPRLDQYLKFCAKEQQLCNDRLTEKVEEAKRIVVGFQEPLKSRLLDWVFHHKQVLDVVNRSALGEDLVSDLQKIRDELAVRTPSVSVKKVYKAINVFDFPNPLLDQTGYSVDQLSVSVVYSGSSGDSEVMECVELPFARYISQAQTALPGGYSTNQTRYAMPQTQPPGMQQMHQPPMMMDPFGRLVPFGNVQRGVGNVAMEPFHFSQPNTPQYPTPPDQQLEQPLDSNLGSPTVESQAPEQSTAPAKKTSHKPRQKY